MRALGRKPKMSGMTTHLAVSKVLLVADARNVSTGPGALAIRRYRLARRRLEGRTRAPITPEGRSQRPRD
jgi:hypothetical protein